MAWDVNSLTGSFLLGLQRTDYAIREIDTTTGKILRTLRVDKPAVSINREEKKEWRSAYSRGDPERIALARQMRFPEIQSFFQDFIYDEVQDLYWILSYLGPPKAEEVEDIYVYTILSPDRGIVARVELRYSVFDVRDNHIVIRATTEEGYEQIVLLQAMF